MSSPVDGLVFWKDNLQNLPSTFFQYEPVISISYD